MELFIHFGIYKTGSSFLQTNCARNRDVLKLNGIWFPFSEREEDMLAGRISPGNGSKIYYLLSSNDQESVQKLIKRWIKEAEGNNCKKILISDEALIHNFANNKSLTMLKDCVAANGIQSVKCLGFFRDPIDHCLSTYKHRAKKGTILNFKNWVENEYETIEVIQNFLKHHLNTNFQWTIRKYDRDGNKMADFFFKDWLNVEGIELFILSEVNPSLTISELAFIQSLGKWDAGLVKTVYNGFLFLPKTEKAGDQDTENDFRKIAFDILVSKRQAIDRLNEILPTDQQLYLNPPVETKPHSNLAYQFSDSQLDSMAKSILEGSKVTVKVSNLKQALIKKIKRK